MIERGVWVKLFGSAALVALAIAAGGCGDDTGSSEGGGGSGDGGGGSAPQADPEVFECEEADLQLVRPLSGPGFDEEGAMIDPQQATYVVSTTVAYATEEQQSDFFAVLGPVMQQLDGTEGLLGYALASGEACGSYRTISVWESDEAMFAFVVAGAHAVAMEEAPNVSVGAKVIHWSATPEEIAELTFESAMPRLEEIDPSPVYD